MKLTGVEGKPKKKKKYTKRRKMEMKENNTKGKKIGQTKEGQGERKLEKGKSKNKILFSSLFRVT